MAVSNFTFPTNARIRFLNGTFDLDTDTFKCALFTASVSGATLAAATTYAGLTNETTNGSGYTTGGVTLSTVSLAGTTTVTWDFSTDPSWTASGGSITAAWAVVYENGGDVLCYCMLDDTSSPTPTNVVTASGNTLALQLASGGILQLS